MKSWVICGDVLEIADGEGRSPASTDDVYASVIEQIEIMHDLPTGKCGHAKRLEFSRFPVEFRAALAACPDTGAPLITFEGKTHFGSIVPVSPAALVRGHVVRDEVWYPGVPGSSEEVLSILDDADYEMISGTCKTLRGYLTLKKAAAQGGPITDVLSDGSLKAHLFSQSGNNKPVGIFANLYPYQIDGWNWLRFIVREEIGGLLADEMGLGKTLQVISALRDEGGGKKAAPSLVIAPSSLLENWIRELARFCPDFKSLKHCGPLRTGRPADLLQFEIVVTSYDVVVRDLSLFKMIKWRAVILDEAQNIRNPDTARSISVKQISRDIGLAVTGTPLENRMRDLWSIIDFAVPGYLGTLDEFEERHGETASDAISIEPIISPVMLRRRVSEVAADLPERINIPEVLELSIEEAELYDELRESIYEEYGKAATLVSIGKLRQFCADPRIVNPSKTLSFGDHFSKFVRLQELLEEILTLGEKALVFTSYTAMADLIVKAIGERFGIMSATLDGRLSVSERQPLIDLFSSHVGPALLVLNPRAGGSGLNITAANHVIHYNPEWNPAIEDQASARAHRLGQQRPVTVRRLAFAGTVEEVIVERLKRKREIADAAIVGVQGKEQDYSDILRALQRSPIQSNSSQARIR